MYDPAQQTQTYRQRASEFEQLAERSNSPDARDRYLRLAEEWRRLADSSEAMSARWGARPQAEPLRRSGASR